MEISLTIIADQKIAPGVELSSFGAVEILNNPTKCNLNMNLKELKSEEFETVYALLQESKLDYSDLKQPNIRVFRFEENSEVIGVGGLEIFDDLALLRSVAIKKERQSKGFGKEIVHYIEEAAKKSGIGSLYLLTNTAPVFFEAIGYLRINRDDFAESLKQTAQFSGLCPVSAVFMKKIL